MKKSYILFFVLWFVSKTYGAQPWINEADLFDVVSGTVVDRSETPIPGAILQWQNAEMFMPNLKSEPIKTDENGQFKIACDMKTVFGRVLCISNPNGTLFNTFHIGTDDAHPELVQDYVRNISRIQDVKITVHPTRRIAGVVHDTNGDPIHGATVYSPFSASSKDVVSTGEDGGFTITFPQSPPFDDFITVFKSGIGIATVNLRDGNYSFQRGMQDGLEPPFKLTQAVVLSKPFGPVKVQVVDHAGKPLPSIKVSHFRTPIYLPNEEVATTRNVINIPGKENTYFNDLYPFSQTTDKDGFAVIDVPYPEDLARTILVAASAPDFIPCKVDAKTRARGRDGVVRITAPNILSVCGTLKYPDGKPAANVRLFGKIYGHDRMPPSQQYSYTITDSRGRYRLPIRPLEERQPIDSKNRGDYQNLPFCFSVLDENWTSPTACVVVRYDGTGKNFLEIPESDVLEQLGVDVRKDESDAVFCDFTLSNTITITGKALYNNDPREPILQAVVQLERLIDGYPNGTGLGKFNVRTDKDGSYSLIVPPGKYKITLYHAANQTSSRNMETISIPGQNGFFVRDEAESETIILDGKQEKYVHNVSSSQTNGVTYHGILVSSDKTPIPHGTISIRLIALFNSGNEIRLNAADIVTVTSDQNGKFVYTRSIQDKTIVAAVFSTISNDDSVGGFLLVSEDESKKIVDVELVAKPLVSLSGRLVDAETGEPYASRGVSVTDGLFSSSMIDSVEIPEVYRSWLRIFYPGVNAQTDEDGNFTLKGLIEGLSYELSVNKTVPPRFTNMIQNSYKQFQFARIDLPSNEGDGNMGDIELSGDLLELQSDEYREYFDLDVRPLEEKLEDAKNLAECENKQIMILVGYIDMNFNAIQAKSNQLRSEFIDAYIRDRTQWQYYLITIVNNTRNDGNTEESRQIRKSIDSLGFTDEEKKQTMLCIMNADGEVIRKAAFVPLMESDDKWAKFFTE